MATSENPKVFMMVAAGKALDYRTINPSASSNEIMQFVVNGVEAEGSAKIGAIAAADRAIKYKEQNPRSSDKEIMQRIMNETPEILEALE